MEWFFKYPVAGELSYHFWRMGRLGRGYEIAIESRGTMIQAGIRRAESQSFRLLKG